VTGYKVTTGGSTAKVDYLNVLISYSRVL